jgi:hypothetical protein
VSNIALSNAPLALPFSYLASLNNSSAVHAASAWSRVLETTFGNVTGAQEDGRIVRAVLDADDPGGC